MYASVVLNKVIVTFSFPGYCGLRRDSVHIRGLGVGVVGGIYRRHFRDLIEVKTFDNTLT